MLKGVQSVLPGYAGGTVPNPTYEQVCGGTTGHVEVVKIEYDQDVIDLEKLLTVFFATHDPTTLNRQGNDVGTQYRSVVFYSDDEQKAVAEKFIADLNASSFDGKTIVTAVEPLDVFYLAEDYHRDYFARNSEQPYCQIIINPNSKRCSKIP
jgi:peptide-methionine (S)-S-oxide reductase